MSDEPRAKPEPPLPEAPGIPECFNCKFWRQHPDRALPTDRSGRIIFKAANAPPHIGMCHRRSPSVGDEKWPYCYGNEWCGEFVPKVETVATPQPTPAPTPQPIPAKVG